MTKFKIGDLLINRYKEIALVTDVRFAMSVGKEGIVTRIFVCANNKNTHYYLYKPEEYWKLLNE